MAIGQVGLGLDFSLGMSFEDQRTLAQEAAALGYQSLWTPEGAGLDSFHLCSIRNQASGLATGIGVCPIAYRSPVAFAMSAGTVSAMSDGKFSLGIGSGGHLSRRRTTPAWSASTLDARRNARVHGRHQGAAGW